MTKKNTLGNLLVVFMLLAVLFAPGVISAQEKQKVNSDFSGYGFIGINGGVSQYFGDLNKNDFFDEKISWGAGVLGGYQISPVFGLRGQFVTGRLKAERTDTHFQKLDADYFDLGLNFTVNINELFGKYNPDRLVNFYLFGGPGFSWHHTLVTDLDGIKVIETDGRDNEFIVPVGAGVAFRLTKSVDLTIEYGDHLTFNDDKLDFLKTTDPRDHYSYASAGLCFKLYKKDRDQDGIIDKKDLCPETPGLLKFQGCPDKDGDGIIDKEDDCPNVAGLIEFKGCPDTDGDGIPDKDDACPADVGKKELNGCPDKDNDGIADKDDRCPTEVGKKEYKGCPDKDGDGIPDIDDSCPDIPGTVAFKGCPDTDGDGIPDNKDQCPEVAGTVANNGCPEVKKGAERVVYFDTDKSFVIEKYKTELDELADFLKANPKMRISVSGHTDSRESEAYNMALSDRRATYVCNYLAKKGVKKSRIDKYFYGKSRPVASNDTPEGMALNRRVEISQVK
jgi:outer membrane protein OmpA-like peptidoglycan-associated protein/opacity protein-like surface antigen